MVRKRSWTLLQLKSAVTSSTSVAQVIGKLGLIPAGGNYAQVNKYILENNIDTSHFLGKAWAQGKKHTFKPRIPLEKILVKHSSYQSFKLKRRLFAKGIKLPKCELCGWAQYSKDGRLPLELDHINGEHSDNRIENLRILCPNCHSLQSTHRGRNHKTKKPEIEGIN